MTCSDFEEARFERIRPTSFEVSPKNTRPKTFLKPRNGQIHLPPINDVPVCVSIHYTYLYIGIWFGVIREFSINIDYISLVQGRIWGKWRENRPHLPLGLNFFVKYTYFYEEKFSLVSWDYVFFLNLPPPP